MINDTKITLLFGLPGAGKTTALAKVMANDNRLLRLSGGSLIGAELKEADRDRLRKLGTDQVLLNQEKLVINFQYEVSSLRGVNVVFDGHCVVKNGANIVEIPLSVIERLKPDQIVFFDAEPIDIIIRRQNDTSRPDREIESEADLERLRAFQKRICANYGEKLSIPFYVVENDEELREKLL